jgi:uncharacterized repeat protein (TIGR01451 family)
VPRPQGDACDIGAYEATAELELTKFVTPTADVPYHGVVTYTAVLSNNGALTDTNVLFTDTLPAKVDFGAFVGAAHGASVMDDKLTWTGTVTAAEAITWTWTMTHTGDYGEVITNTAKFSSTRQTGSARAEFWVIPAYVITPTAGAGGSIHPPTLQTVARGDDITFTISPDTGYHIADVLRDDVSVGAVESYTFENVTADHTLSATFAINTYVITPTAGVGGSISPDTPQTVNHSDDIAFTISPDTGYHVVDVGADGISVGAVSAYTFETVTADHTISATFEQDAYTLMVDIIGSGNVTRVPSQTTYLHSEVVTLTATPDAGWYFGQWGGDASGTLTQTTVTMNADKAVTATFVETPPAYYTLTMHLVGSGVITPSMGAHSYLSGTAVALHARPADGWQFDRWRGAVMGTLTLTQTQVVMDADKDVTATFTVQAGNTVYLPLLLQGSGGSAR